MIKPQTIVIDGPDGVGKTTQVQLLAAFLASHGANVHVTRASGGTPIGEELRKASLSLHPRRAETDVYISLAMHTELGHDIQQRKKAGEVVIVDRSPLTVIGYNLYGSRLANRQLAYDACTTLLQLWEIDVFVYLDAPQAMLDERRQKRGNVDYFENQDSEFHHRVRKGYEEGLEFLKSSPKYVKHLAEIDGSLSVEAIQKRIQQTVAR